MSGGSGHEWSLAQLHFGRDDAELDIAQGLLRDGFIKTVAFNEAANGRKNLIIGRKGSGKSAICMRLLMPANAHNAAILITPDDAAGEEIRRFELQGLNNHSAKSLVWRYVFLIHLSRHLVSHVAEVHERKPPASIKRLRRFLLDNGELEDGRLYERLLKGASGLHGSLSLEAFGAKAGIDVKGAAEGARASRDLDSLEREIEAVATDLGCAEQHSPLLLMVDQLEQIWSNDADSDAMIIGLLLAARHFTARYSGLARCVLFLRSDIYDALHFGEGDKFHSAELRIEWDQKRLAELAFVRARATLGSNLTHDQFWSEVLPPRIRGEKAQDYVLARTLPRPRDMIQFLNAMRDAAFEGDHTRIEESDAVSATLRFSQWKLQDLAKEYLITYPFLDRLLLIFQNTGYLVTRTSVARALEPLMETLRRLFPGYVDSMDADNVVDILYAVGFLGVKRGSGVHYSGGHHIPLQPHENIFEIHPCFRTALNAEKETKLEPIELAGARGVQVNIVGAGNIQVNSFGFEGRVVQRAGREADFLKELSRSCERILSRLGRVQLPNGLRSQVVQEIAKLDRETQRTYESAIVGGRPHIVREFAFAAAAFLDDLSRQLAESGLSDAGDLEAAQRAIQEESHRLRGNLRGSWLP